MIAFRILQKHGGAASVHYQAVKCSAMIITQTLPGEINYTMYLLIRPTNNF